MGSRAIDHGLYVVARKDIMAEKGGKMGEEQEGFRCAPQTRWFGEHQSSSEYARFGGATHSRLASSANPDSADHGSGYLVLRTTTSHSPIKRLSATATICSIASLMVGGIG